MQPSDKFVGVGASWLSVQCNASGVIGVRKSGGGGSEKGWGSGGDAAVSGLIMMYVGRRVC